MVAHITNIMPFSGVMQDFYERTMFDHIPNAQLQLSFVGTICLVFVHGMGPFAQILRSIVGTTTVYVIGSALMTIGLICAGFSTQVSSSKHTDIVILMLLGNRYGIFILPKVSLLV